MGYRTYIGFMPKKEYNKIKSLTKNEMFDFYKIKSDNESDDDDDDRYKGVYEFGKELYEFGKYTDFEPPKKSMKSFFKKPCLKEMYEEYDFYIVTPEFLAYLIENYSNKVRKYYDEMIMPFMGEESDFLNSVEIKRDFPDNNYAFDFSKITNTQQTALFKIIEHVRSMRTEWVQLTPYDLEGGDSITTSWKFEYGVFELVRIYKSFDWKRNVMIYYGY